MSRINVTRSSLPPFDEYVAEIKDLWDTRWLTNMGAKHQALQRDLCKFLDIRDIVLFTNGHLALEGAWEALSFPSGSEVITTPFSFCSTTNAFVRKGLVPVFCDIDPDTFCIDSKKIEGLINEKTVAICPVHVYGNMCDVETIDGIAKRHHLAVVYDAAHAFGVMYKGVSSAKFGDISMFSFHATKVFNTIEGGALCLNCGEGLVEKLNDIKDFGLQYRESAIRIGGNAKMNEFQAAMGLCNLRHLHEEIRKRETAYLRYMERLQGVPGIKLPSPQEFVQPNYAYFPVVFDGYKKSRDAVFAELKANGILSRKYFYPLINDMECYKNNRLYSSAKTPIAKHVSDCVLALPIYAGLSLEEVDEICDIIVQ